MIPNGSGCYGPRRRVPRPLGAWRPGPWPLSKGLPDLRRAPPETK